MYICETCGKEFGHRGDFIKHVEVRKSPCVRDTKSQALIDRLEAMEKAMNTVAEAAGIKLNVEHPIQQQNNMSFPLSKTAFDEAIATAADIQVGKDIAAKDLYKVDDGYFNYLKDFIKANGLDVKYNEAGIKKLRRHADLDDIIKLYSVYDAMNALPAGTKIASKQSLLTDYFGGKFNKNAIIVEAAKVEEVDILPSDSKEAAMLKTMFARFEQQLRDNAGITGEKARDDIIALFVFRLLQPRFESGEIDIMDVEKNIYPVNLINKDNIKYCLMKNLAALQKESMMVELGKIWRLVLSNHQTTGMLFRADKFLNIKDDSLLASIVSELVSFNFENCDHDTISEVYQHFIHKQFKGDKSSKLGQHFTPIHIVKFIASYVTSCFNGNQHVIRDGSMIDPFMGTGGFIMNAYRFMKNIRADSPDRYLYGSEIDNDVFICAAANLVISTGVVCTGLQSRNAFAEPNGAEKNKKYSMILTNPPFSIKFTDKDSYNKTTWFNQAKIKNGNMVCLQYNMHILAPGGICSMVWLFGSECFSTSKKTEVEIRKRLFTEFDVLSVIVLPKGTFEYTSIATVIITFRKPIQGEIIVPKLKIYQYKDGAKTVDELEILADVASDKLREKKFVIDPNAYKEIALINNIRPIFEMKKLEDVCDFKNGTAITVSELKGDKYPVIGGGKSPMGRHNESNTAANTILVSKDGAYAGYVTMYDSETFINNSCMKVIPKEGVNNKFVYYFMKYECQQKIYDMQTGAAQPHVYSSQLKEIPIPVPSMVIQNEIVSIVERFEAGISSMQESIKGIEFQIEVLSKKQFVFKEGEFEMKKLGDVCDFKNGTAITVSELKGDKYPAIGGGKSPMGRHNESNTPANTILVSKDGAYAGYIAMYDSETFINNSCMKVIPNDGIDNKFVYYFMKYECQQKIYDMQTGAAQPHVYSSQLKEISIPIPSVEIQKQIANKIDALYENMNRMKAMKHESEEFAKIEIKELFK
jgi:restriction endonuclease S subunit/type I restriction-modification system DNA methylase subunit